VSVSHRFSDSFGFQWQVCEVSPRARRSAGDEPSPNVAPDGRGSLYFFSRETTRVLLDFQARWELLTWPELEDLCARAKLIGVDRFERPTPRVRERLVEARL
jgi:hypothetical protein